MPSTPAPARCAGGTPTESTVDSSPALQGGTLWIGSDDHKVYALEAKTGEWIWEFLTGRAAWFPPPSLVDGILYVGSYDGKLYALDADNRQASAGDYPTGNGIRSSPDARGRPRLRRQSRLLPVRGRRWCPASERWRFETDGPIDDSSPLVVDGLVYVGSLDHRVYAVSAIDGRVDLSERLDYTGLAITVNVDSPIADETARRPRMTPTTLPQREHRDQGDQPHAAPTTTGADGLDDAALIFRPSQ